MNQRRKTKWNWKGNLWQQLRQTTKFHINKNEWKCDYNTHTRQSKKYKKMETQTWHIKLKKRTESSI